jgi:phosphinothricin acetyltransferase
VSEPAVRAARAADAEAMAAVFAEGIADRVATLQTTPSDATEMAALAESGTPVVVAEREGAVVGWAKVSAYDPVHDYYSTVGEVTLYVARAARGGGIGRALLRELELAAAAARFHKLVGKIFTSNEASSALFRACGWSEVGVHRRHGRLDGHWKDVLVVEKLLGDAAG